MHWGGEAGKPPPVGEAGWLVKAARSMSSAADASEGAFAGQRLD